MELAFAARSSASIVALVLVVLGVDGCCGRMSKCREPGERPEVSPGAPRALPPPRTGGLAPSPDHAVVVTQDGVVALDGEGKRVFLVAPQTDVSWCRVDPRSRVLWLRHGENGTLSLVDLESDAPPTTVLERTPETVVISYGTADLGMPGMHEFMDGVVVRVRERPEVEAILGCEGDMTYACFDDAGDIQAAYAKRLAELEATLGPSPLQSRDVLAALARRSQSYEEPSDAPLGPEPQPVSTVPPEPCSEAPEDCGAATRLPGTPYWLVVVANSRGDFFHQTYQLYDPVKAEFFDPRDPKARSRQPLAASGDTFVPSFVSPSGELGLDDDALVRLEGGIVASGFSGVCGFWGGGWETPL